MHKANGLQTDFMCQEKKWGVESLVLRIVWIISKNIQKRAKTDFSGQQHHKQQK